jgi:hypothetical protein
MISVILGTVLPAASKDDVHTSFNTDHSLSSPLKQRAPQNDVFSME